MVHRLYHATNDRFSFRSNPPAYDAEMIKSYLKLAYRNLLKNKVASLINIVGLSLAVGCSIVTYLFVYSQIFNESFHEHADHIFLVEMVAEQNQEVERWASTPRSLGPRIEAELPDVAQVIRMQDASTTVVQENFEFGDGLRFVDAAYFEMFTLPLKYGNLDRWLSLEDAVISEPTALKLFGDRNPVGETFTIRQQNGEMYSFTVKAVTERLKYDSIAGFSILLSYDNFDRLVLSDEAVDSADWSHLTRSTFIQLRDPGDKRLVEDQLHAYVEPANTHAEQAMIVQSFRLNNLQDIRTSSEGLRNGFGFGIAWAPIILLSTLTLFLFLLACFNYINVALGSTHVRAKEIGVRKVMGSKRSQLVTQFLTENVLLCMSALVLGALIASSFLVPAFNTISGGAHDTNLLSQSNVLFFLIGLLVFTALVSGAYPALVIASYKPIAIFTGRFKIGSPSRLMKLLMVIQFTLSMITMMLSAGMTLNNGYLMEKDWGYDNSNTLVIRLFPDAYPVMYSSASQLPQVEKISGAKTHVGAWPRTSNGAYVSGQRESTVHFEVGLSYFDIIKPRLIAGVHPTLPAQVLVNAEFASRFEDHDMLGQTVTFDSTNYVVSGIVENFHFNDFSSTIDPAMFSIANESDFNFMLVRMRPGTEQETVSALASTWNENFAEAGFDNFFQDESFEAFFNDAKGITHVFYFTALVALLLACAGLFGLASQNTTSRIKEMSIRKILGATTLHVTQITNRSFGIMVLVASLVATPASYFIIDFLLGSFSAYSMPIGPAPFLITLCLTLLTALLTISIQIHRLATMNPAELLRNE